MKLDGKVAIVTGGGRNIGEAISVLLASEGAKVAVVDMDEARGTQVAGQIKEHGGEAIAVLGDVSKSEDVQAMVKRAVDEWGRVDILVNNVAISDRAPILELADEEWSHVIDVTLTSQFLCTKYAAKQMVAQGGGGAIVNFTASSVGSKGNTARIAYNSAKSGVNAVTYCSAAQLAPHNIRVNGVGPGVTGSRVGDQVTPNRGFHNLQNRMGQPEDQAKAVLFLVSDDSPHITGHILNVDGGVAIM